MRIRHAVTGAIVLAALLLGGLWLFLRQVSPRETVSVFQQTCLQGQRRGISGDIRPLDETTEARLLAFCGCVETEVRDRLSDQDIAAIGLQRSSKDVDEKIQTILALCRTRNP